jgi:sporulation protein YlmC with PRC-barrel domain
MTKKLMLGTALAALMLSGAFAQAPTDPNASPPAASKSEATSNNAQVVASQKPDQWLASNFKGTDVVGSDNAKIGDVTDILFDKHGKIEAYVVSVGGFLGMGSKSVAIAPNSFDVVPGSNGSADKLKLSMTKDQLKEAQNFQPYEAPRPTTTGSAPGNRPMGGGMKPPGTAR